MSARTMMAWVACLCLGVSLTSGCKRTLTITLDGTGEVMNEDGSIQCKDKCTTELEKGAQVTLSAAAPPGSSFAGWGGSCTGTEACALTLEDNHAVSARFVRTARVIVEVEGDGEGTLVSGQPCSRGCELDLVEGAPLKLEAKPADGMAFAGWNGACTGTGDCQLTARGEQKVVATFVIPVGTVLGKGRLEVLPGRHVADLIATSTEDTLIVASSGGPPKEAVEIVRADAAGSRMWTKLPKPEVMNDLRAMVRLDDGGFAVVGAAGRADCAFARYREDNERAWNVALPDCGKVVDLALTGPPGERVLVALGQLGTYGSGYNFLGTPVRMKGGADAFLARFDDSGQLIDVATHGTRKGDEPGKLAISPDGAITYFTTCAGKSCQLVALGADGAEMWSQAYNGDQLEVRDLGVSPTSVYVVGRVDKKRAKAGAGLLKGLRTAGVKEGCDGGLGVIVRLARSGGQPSTTKVLGSVITHVLPRAEDVVVLGAYGPRLELAGEALGDGECEDEDEAEAFVAGLSEEGDGKWVRRFDKAPTHPEALVTNADGHVIALARGLGTAGAVDEEPPGEASWLRLK